MRFHWWSLYKTVLNQSIRIGLANCAVKMHLHASSAFNSRMQVSALRSEPLFDCLGAGGRPCGVRISNIEQGTAKLGDCLPGNAELQLGMTMERNWQA